MGSITEGSIMKRILVTGGAGFIGSHTVDFILAQGIQVVVYDNMSSGKLTYLDLFNPNLRLLQADILDYKKLASEIVTCDAVLHLAAIPSVPRSVENPIESLQVNLLGFLNVLQAIRYANTKIRLVYASSAAVYGNATHLPCDDTLPLSEPALSPYALEKASDERYATLFAKLFGIESLGLRYFNVYGPRQDPSSPYSGVISKFISQYKQRETVTVFGDGKQSRDFIHVSDIVQANWLALQSDYSGVLNVATGKPETLLNMIHYIEEAGGLAADTQLLPERAGDIRDSYATVAQVKKHLGFEAKMSLAHGLGELLSG